MDEPFGINRPRADVVYGGKRMGRAVDYIIQNIFEPSLNWALSHPILSVVAVAALIYFSVRNYRML